LPHLLAAHYTATPKQAKEPRGTTANKNKMKHLDFLLIVVFNQFMPPKLFIPSLNGTKFSLLNLSNHHEKTLARSH
jgi:hypothetical protein